MSIGVRASAWLTVVERGRGVAQLLGQWEERRMAEETPLPEAYSPPSPAWRAAFSPQAPTAAEQEVSMSPMQRELDRRIAFLESQLRENASPKDEWTAAAEVRPT
jgi:hypothetical protein